MKINGLIIFIGNSRETQANWILFKIGYTKISHGKLYWQLGNVYTGLKIFSPIIIGTNKKYLLQVIA